MKKVEFMKLNLQQENILSKEERKDVLGGQPSSCYVVCKNDGRRVNVDRCDSYSISAICGESGARCCGCEGTCY